MLTRTTIARLTPTARRILGGNAWKKHARLPAALLLSLAMGAATLAADDSAGVVRVSDQPPQPASKGAIDVGFSAPAETPVGNPPAAANGPNAAGGPVVSTEGPPEGCPPAHLSCLGCCCLGHCLTGEGHCCGCCGACYEHLFGKDANGKGLLARCCPFKDGNCGWRFLDAHCYCMTYPVSPWYCDGRDGRVYAAYGYGAPMTVPLAPTVTNQYNYGWGIPSGRLTPISRVAPRPGAITAAVAPY